MSIDYYITKVGIGQAGSYNDLKVFDDSSNDSQNNTKVAFPNAGLFPIDLVDGGVMWSLSLPNKINEFPAYNKNIISQNVETTSDSKRVYTSYRETATTPKVTIHDNTDNVDVPVSDVQIDPAGYGYFGSGIAYKPDKKYIKIGHSYIIAFDGLPGNKPYSYTTKFFDLGKSNSIY